MTVAAPIGACPICGDGSAPDRHAAREMMFGFRDPFTYGECRACGCLVLLDPPPDLERYYPADYYSFGEPPVEPRLRRWLKRRWTEHLTGQRNLAGALLELTAAVRPPGMAAVAAVALAAPSRGAAILDVGSGAYGVLHLLHDAGFRDLTGIDPFIARSHEPGAGFRILRGELHDLEGDYDVVVMSHSLEHMPDQAGALRIVHGRLRPGGALIIRTPIAARTWREFRGDWVELDAPRHLLVHSDASLRILAARTGFTVECAVCDSSADELWGSLQYRADIALREPRSWIVDPAASPFTRADLRRMQREVRVLNRTGAAGRASYLLRKA